ncbi:MAG TPA: DNA-3-methyladenine glycosylase 2 family protein [Candidatus Dormibacteraeota bacterium]|nr:DNA-3-methyladenine glycosylase 2 family protein [Candidatus Dormibacteraeota bacterium]
MHADEEGEFRPRTPLDLRRTLSLLGHGPWIRREDRAVWVATRTPAGAATLQIARHNGTVATRAWGPGAAWAVAQAPELCGEGDDDSGFAPAHPLLARLNREVRGMRMPRTKAVFEALVPTVIGQQVTSEEARESYRHLVNALCEPAPGPVRLKLPPAPREIARTPYWAFHRFGVERRRADVIIRAARSAKRLEEITTMDLPSAYRRMMAFPGVGPWTAAKVAMVALGDADAVPLGDYHLPHSIGYIFDGTARSTDERMLEILEPYRGHRARVIRLIVEAGIAAPRFGPRKPLRQILDR